MTKFFAGSVVRWYPDPESGEFINIGVICGRDDDWHAYWAVERSGHDRDTIYAAVKKLLTALGLGDGGISLLSLMWEARQRHANGRLELVPPSVATGETAEEIVLRFRKVYLK